MLEVKLLPIPPDWSRMSSSLELLKNKLATRIMLDLPSLSKHYLKTDSSLNVQQHIITLEHTINRNVLYLLLQKRWEQCVLVF